MSRTGIVKQTLEILDRGHYLAPSGRSVEVRGAIDRAVAGTVLHEPEAFVDADLAGVERRPGTMRVEVTDETTGAAARRLLEVEGETHVVALNFASAKYPGGGFVRGAKAQEEDLACCSALYGCLLTQPRYYDSHRASSSMLYSDRMIYSPDVPFFRGEDGGLLDRPFLLSIITSPAPNAGEVRRHASGEEDLVRPTLENRAAKILRVAAAHRHRCLVLGAWGCGVFRNDPEDVARAFARIEDEDLRGVFDRVVFAVYERGPDRPNWRAFQDRFGSAARRP